MGGSVDRDDDRSGQAGKRQDGFADAERYRVLFEQANDAIFIHDMDGQLLEVNAMACERLGYSRGELLGMDLRAISPPEHAGLVGQRMEEIRREGRITAETVVCTRDGRLIPVEISSRLIDYGEDSAVLCISRDISERKRMEQALEQERSRLRMMLSHESLISTVAARFNSTDPFEKNLDELLPLFGKTAALDSVVVWQLDESAGRADIYSRWESARGVRYVLAREFCRDDLPAFFDGIIGGRVLAAGPGMIEDDLREYFKFSSECALLTFPLSFGGRVKGAIRFSRANGVDWSKEEISMFGAVSEIVTNAWEREIEFRARLAAERSHTDSIKMVERATRLASIGVIAAGITHEINQPLNAIRLTSDGTMMWIERHGIDLPVKIIDRLSKIGSYVERITRIINHMREFWAPTQQDSGVFDLGKAVEDALGLVEQQTRSHGIALRRNYCDQPLPVAGDRLHVEQITINLIVNAMQALDGVEDAGKLLEISTSLEKEFCVLEVADNGPGFTEQNREQMFDMFYSAKRPGEGTGLGLAIVKRYAEELGGMVEAQSRAGSDGALFRVRIPLAEHRQEEP